MCGCRVCVAVAHILDCWSLRRVYLQYKVHQSPVTQTLRHWPRTKHTQTCKFWQSGIDRETISCCVILLGYVMCRPDVRRVNSRDGRMILFVDLAHERHQVLQHVMYVCVRMRICV